MIDLDVLVAEMWADIPPRCWRPDRGTAEALWAGWEGGGLVFTAVGRLSVLLGCEMPCLSHELCALSHEDFAGVAQALAAIYLGLSPEIEWSDDDD